MSDTPATLAHPATHQLEVKKSRFLALAEPLQDPQEAQAVLARVADPQATHNCWAWRIGQAYRFSDDGEPGGTAGRPILAAIDGQRFDQVMVVVTRWFGGVKLGAGGLVRAYGGAAAECLRTAPRLPLLAWREATVHCAFALEAPLRTLLAELGAEPGAARYDGHGLQLPLRVLEPRLAELERRLRDLSRGRATLTVARTGPSPVA